MTPRPNIAAIRSARGLTEGAACQRLRRAARMVPATEAIVELGAYRGRATGWLALGAYEGRGARILSIDPWDLLGPDGHPAYADTVERNYREGGYAGARASFLKQVDASGLRDLVTDVQGFAADEGRKYEGPPVGLLWHDAQHTAEAVEEDLRAWLPHMAPRSTIVLHDVGSPTFGIEAGAAAVLADDPRWSWTTRRIDLWSKRPDARGTLTIRAIA